MEENKEKKPQKLNYRLIESTSEDPEYPLYELLKGKHLLTQVLNQMAGSPFAFAHTLKKL